MIHFQLAFDFVQDLRNNRSGSFHRYIVLGLRQIYIFTLDRSIVTKMMTISWTDGEFVVLIVTQSLTKRHSFVGIAAHFDSVDKGSYSQANFLNTRNVIVTKPLLENFWLCDAICLRATIYPFLYIHYPEFVCVCKGLHKRVCQQRIKILEAL